MSTIIATRAVIRQSLGKFCCYKGKGHDLEKTAVQDDVNYLSRTTKKIPLKQIFS